MKRVFYGWIIVACCFLLTAVSQGIWYSFAIFFVAILDEFGGSRGATAGAFSLANLVLGGVGILVGRLVDRLGSGRVIAGGALVIGAALWLSSTSAGLAPAYLYLGLLLPIGISSISGVPQATLLSNWFARRRGTVVGIAYAGMGLGILIMGPLAQYLISRVGWRYSYRILGVVVPLILWPVAYFARIQRPQERGFFPDDARPGAGQVIPSEGSGPPRREWTLRAAMRTHHLWGLMGCYCFTSIGVYTLTTHQVAYVVDLGYTKLLAATVFGIMGFMSTGGKILFAAMSDRIGRVRAALVSFGCTASGTLALMLLQPFRHLAWLWIYAVAFGMSFGARGPIIVAVSADVFLGRTFGAITGLLALGHGIGAAIGPWLGGAIYDAVGSYQMAFALAIGAIVLAGLSFWVAASPHLPAPLRGRAAAPASQVPRA
jgi:MFS family permease